MSKMPSINVRNIKTYVFFDLETTGLIRGTRMPKITEMSLIASSRDAIFLDRKNDTIPRVTHKLTIPLQPMRLIPFEVSQITGLYNDLLEKERPFDEEACLLLDIFVRRLCPPVCFVAHNGNRFDYPILLSELNRIGKNFVDDILCVDSYVAFKALLEPTHSNDISQSAEPKTETVNPDSSLLDDGCDEAALAAVVDLHSDLCADFVDETGEKLETQAQRMQKLNETTPVGQIGGKPRKPFDRTKALTVRRNLAVPANFKLETVYEHLVGGAPLDAHSAEGDCLSLLACVMKIGDPFAKWADINARPMRLYTKN